MSLIDSALGETHVTCLDPHQIHQSGMPHMSVLYYCDDALHFWKAANCCGIHLCLHEPYAVPAPLGWHCRDNHLHCLYWLGSAERPSWAFLRFGWIEKNSISQFPTPPLVCQFQLVLASSSFRCLIQHLVVIWYLQMWGQHSSSSASGHDKLPLSLFLVFRGQLNSNAKAWKFCYSTGQIKELFRRAFLFLTFWKMISFTLRPLTLLCRRSPSFHYKEVIGKKQIWYVVEVKRTGKALSIPITAFVEESSQTLRQKPPMWDVCVQTLSFLKSY